MCGHLVATVARGRPEDPCRSRGLWHGGQSLRWAPGQLKVDVDPIVIPRRGGPIRTGQSEPQRHPHPLQTSGDGLGTEHHHQVHDQRGRERQQEPVPPGPSGPRSRRSLCGWIPLHIPMTPYAHGGLSGVVA